MRIVPRRKVVISDERREQLAEHMKSIRKL
jgi:hypothetical protein